MVAGAFLLLLTPAGLLALVGGGLIGLIVGTIPGLGPVFGIALFLPFTFWFPTHYALIFLGSLYCCCVYGGALTTITLGIPGTAGNLPTAFDGHALARQGKAGFAIGLSTAASAIGGMIGVIVFAFLTPVLASWSLRIGPSEYFLLAAFGISMVGWTSEGNTVAGIVLGCVGILVSNMGLDVITGEPRATFGTIYLSGGIPFVPSSIGLFGLAQALAMAEEGGTISKTGKVFKGVGQGIRYVMSRPLLVLRHSLMGSMVGIIPGVGITIASFLSYFAEQRITRAKPSFGEGNPAGVIAPEAANNACVATELIPAFGIGIPGGVTSALFLAAIMMHGLQPGFNLFLLGGTEVWAMVWGMALAQFLFFLFLGAGGNLFMRVTIIPNSILVPTIIAFCYVGAFASRGLILDTVVMTIFGIAGYFLNKARFPIGCFVVGQILGDMAEQNFHRALILSDGSYSFLFVSKISSVLFFLVASLLFFSFIHPKQVIELIQKRKFKKPIGRR